MPGLAGEAHFDAVAVVVVRMAEKLGAVAVAAVISDAFAVGVPVFVADGFFCLASADLPDLAAVCVHAPDAIVHLVPGALVAEGQQITACRRGVDVANPVALLENRLATCAVDGDLDNAAQWSGLPCLAEADIAAQIIDAEAVG